MIVQNDIERLLNDAFSPEVLEVTNESGMHNVPPGSESHFRVLVVTDAFADQGRVHRHRAINKVLADQLAGPVHALAIQALTPAEWETQQKAESPECLGGSAADKH